MLKVSLEQPTFFSQQMECMTLWDGEEAQQVEHQLRFRNIQVQFWAPPPQLTTFCDSISRGSDALSRPPKALDVQAKQTRAGGTLIHVKNK